MTEFRSPEGFRRGVIGLCTAEAKPAKHAGTMARNRETDVFDQQSSE